MDRSRLGRGLAILAVAALAVAVVSPAFSAAPLTKAKVKKIAKKVAKQQINSLVPGMIDAATIDQFHSGLIKLSLGQTQQVTTRGPFSFRAACTDLGGGDPQTDLFVKNTGSTDAVLESDYGSEYYDPTLAPGEEREGFYPTDNPPPVFWGDYNLFAAAASDGTSVYGFGSIGEGVLGADCVVDLFLLG